MSKPQTFVISQKLKYIYIYVYIIYLTVQSDHLLVKLFGIGYPYYSNKHEH